MDKQFFIKKIDSQGDLIIVDDVRYRPKYCSDFKPKDLMYNPFWGSESVVKVPRDTLLISSYNSLYDCWKLEKENNG